MITINNRQHNPLRSVRQYIINSLWKNYRHCTPQMQLIESALKQKGIDTLVLDHFAIIDLPGPHTGIKQLKEIFSALDYIEQGNDYLPTKQNDFLWMTEVDSHLLPAKEVLPQVVVADFRLDELPLEIRKIVEKYSQKSTPAPLEKINYLAKRVKQDNDADAAQQLSDLVLNYLAGRDWPLPTCQEFYSVQKFNELIAWVLIFGRRANHFTLALHHLPQFSDMNEFNQFIENELQLKLNDEGGKIKGGMLAKLAQSSTIDTLQIIQLSDGTIELPTGFVEFVWRYPHDVSRQPILWNDYFTSFIAQHANHVIESLYLNEKKDNLSKVQG